MNRVPFSVILLALLFLFMYVRWLEGLHGHGGRIVDLAAVRNPRLLPEAEREDAIRITVGRDGSIYLGSQRFHIDHLRPRMQELLRERPRQTVFFYCDLRAKYGLVRLALEEVRLAGVYRIAFITEKTREP